MTQFLLIAVGFSVSLLCTFFGIIWKPEFLDTSTYQDNINYAFVMIPWVLSPLWIFLIWSQNVKESLKSRSFLHANLITFFFINAVVTFVDFYELVWQSTNYKTYWSLIATQFVILLIIWIVSKQISVSNASFEKVAVVGANRRDGLKVFLKKESEFLLRAYDFDVIVQKQLDLLLDEVNYLPVYSSNEQFDALLKDSNSWAQSQKEITKDYVLENADQKKIILNNFIRQTILLREKIASTKK